MKINFVFLMIISLSSLNASAVSVLNCLLTERYNDQKLETPVQIPVENGTALFQKTTTRAPQLQMIIYYSQKLSTLGVRITDDALGITSSSFSDPAQENGPAKVRHIRSKPETQLFAIDCNWK